MISKLPLYPRIIKLALTTIRAMEYNKKDQNINNITKIKITTDKNHNNKIIYPEIYTDNWYPLIIDNHCLVTKVRSMLGRITDRREKQLKEAWHKWLENWIKLNGLDIKIIQDKNEKIKAKKKIKKVKEPKKIKKVKEPKKIKKVKELINVLPKPNKDSSSDNKQQPPLLLQDT